MSSMVKEFYFISRLQIDWSKIPLFTFWSYQNSLPGRQWPSKKSTARIFFVDLPMRSKYSLSSCMLTKLCFRNSFGFTQIRSLAVNNVQILKPFNYSKHWFLLFEFVIKMRRFFFSLFYLPYFVFITHCNCFFSIY